MKKVLFLLIVGLSVLFYFESSIISSPILRISMYITFLAGILIVTYKQEVRRGKLTTWARQLLQGEYFSTINIEDLPSNLKDVGQAMLSLRKNLVENIFEMQAVSSQVSAATEQMSLVFEEHQGSSKELYSATQEMSIINQKSQNNLNQMLNEVENIVSLLHKTEDITTILDQNNHTTKQIIQKSLHAIGYIVELIHELEQSFHYTEKNIKKLSQSTSQISNILQTVEGIAKQTQMLALNATIESAKAGELGAGFAVVAQKIRDLAVQSKDAVLQIGQLITTTIDDVEQVTHVVTETMQKVDTSVRHSKNIEESLENIEGSYQNVDNIIQEIIAITEEQNLSINHMTQRVTESNALSEEVTTGFDKVSCTVDTQNEYIEELQNVKTRLVNSASSLTELGEKASLHLFSSNTDTSKLNAQNMIETLTHWVKTHPQILNLDIMIHQPLLDSFIIKNATVEAIWTNDKKGRFIYSNPPAGIANAAVRPWFKYSVEGKNFISEIYISAITKTPCITVSLPIKDHNNQIIGVLGADIALNFSSN